MGGLGRAVGYSEAFNELLSIVSVGERECNTSVEKSSNTLCDGCFISRCCSCRFAWDRNVEIWPLVGSIKSRKHLQRSRQSVQSQKCLELIDLIELGDVSQRLPIRAKPQLPQYWRRIREDSRPWDRGGEATSRSRYFPLNMKRNENQVVCWMIWSHGCSYD